MDPGVNESVDCLVQFSNAWSIFSLDREAAGKPDVLCAVGE